VFSLETIANLTVKDYLAQLAAPVFPAPAVGSAAATTAAMAAALVEMSSEITRKKDRKQEKELGKLIEELQTIRQHCLALATEDMAAYWEVVQANKEKEEFPAAHEAAMKKATDTLVAVVKDCEFILTSIEELIPTCYKKVLGDLLGSTYLAEAAANTARRGVEINLQVINDQNYIKEAAASVRDSYQKCCEAKEKIIASCP